MSDRKRKIETQREMQWQAKNQTTLTQMGILTPPGGRNNHTTSGTPVTNGCSEPVACALCSID